MKLGTLKLYLPAILITTQQTTAGLAIPPFLDHLGYPVSLIGSLISLSPFLALVARLPSGLVYHRKRARMLMAVTLLTMSLCIVLYTYAVQAFHFAFVHALYGFAYGVATTIYLAFFVETLPTGENRHHAMAYYVGFQAFGYSFGGFLGGYIPDKLGFPATFTYSALFGLLCLFMTFVLMQGSSGDSGEGKPTTVSGPTLGVSLKSILEPKLAMVVIVAAFLNMLFQMGRTFLPLYGLAVGLTLTQVGVINGLYALCNAVTRPLSGLFTQRLGARRLSLIALPLQSAPMMLVPLFFDFGPLLLLFILGGFVRAVAITANAISLVEDVKESQVSRGVSSGIFNAAGDVGNILGPGAGGLIASFTGVAYLFMVGPLIIVVLFFLFVFGLSFSSSRRRKAA